MNSIATIDAPTAITSYPDWLNTGRTLASQKRNIDWLIGDWLNVGRQNFPEQITLALTELGEDPKRIKRIECTVAAFPPHLRDASLSFDHHAYVADLPTQDALTLLKKAHDGKLSARQIKVDASVRKIELGSQLLWTDKDIDYTELMAIVRTWNSAQPHIREQFIELATPSHFGIIEA